jgi:hypothetical protein
MRLLTAPFDFMTFLYYDDWDLNPIYMVVRFGEFSTVTFEILNNKLLGEMRRKKVEPGNEHIFASLKGNDIFGALRTYSPTNPGKRSRKYQLDLIAPKRDLEFDLDRIADHAHERFRV